MSSVLFARKAPSFHVSVPIFSSLVPCRPASIVRDTTCFNGGSETRNAAMMQGCAGSTIAKHCLTYTDRFGAPRKRPEVSVEESARIAFARLTRELDLDCGSPSAPSPPALHSNKRQ